MGKLFLYICILICWALVLMNTAAEREYFLQNENLTWNDARNHCQICFKELVTLTPDNIHLITPKLSCDHWIGLRKNFNSTSNSSVLWSRWANGDPLVFQNWYPGWPVFKSPPIETSGCNCLCTCTANTTTESTNSTTDTETDTDDDIYNENMTDFFTFWNSSVRNKSSYINDSYVPATSRLEIDAACELSRMPVVLETSDNESYIEDSCVAMRSFGPWIEKHCTELLPFVCYEDRFFGQVNVTDVTLKSATLSWLPAPGDITHYRVEVTGDTKRTYDHTNTTYYLGGLIPGEKLKVQVFPVKCGRDLNPQNATFYTVPNKVTDLKVDSVTETSVTLGWRKPEGNSNFYLVKTEGRETRKKTDGDENQTIRVDGLIPGSLYTFSVLAGVQDESRWSEESYVTTNTKPGKVCSLNVSDHTNMSVQLSWTAPEGNFTDFRVMAVDVYSNEVYFDEMVNQEERGQLVDELPSGSEISLSVTTLANYTSSPNYTGLALEGDEKTIITYTAPGPISDLTMSTDQNSLNASWSGPAEGNYSSFNVNLTLEGNSNPEKKTTTTKTQVTFTNLKNSANYTLSVFAVNGHVKGLSVSGSIFTKPCPPTDVEVDFRNSSSIAFKWKAPKNTETLLYHVKLNSSFWNYSTSENVTSTKHTFVNLRSGTKYDFEVSALAGGHTSVPASCSNSTVPKKVEISLSMLCTSEHPLLCDSSTTRENVIKRLSEYFNGTVGDKVHWEFPKQENPGT